MPAKRSHLAIYTGSFDPITFGHLDVLARSRTLFDEVILAIGRNPNKAALFSLEERTELARVLVDELVRHESTGAPVRIETYTGLTVDFAQEVGASAIVRGIRNMSDLASECQLAITNRQVAGIETVFIVTGEAFAYTSSSLIQQIAALGGSLDKLNTLVPPVVIEALRRKRDDPNNPLGRLAQDQLVEQALPAPTLPTMSVSFRVISIGALAAHPLWGERGEVRVGHATTTLISTGAARILVDPSLPPQALLPRLDERAKLKPDDITHVFLTSLHPLHRRGIAAFPKAQWFVSAPEREAIGVPLVERFKEARDAEDDDLTKLLLQEIQLVERCQPAPDRLEKGVDLFPLVGVSPGLTGLLLPLSYATVLIAGDAVPTQEHLEQGQVLSPCHDLEAARASFAEAIEIADLIVAGRDNILINPARRPF